VREGGREATTEHRYVDRLYAFTIVTGWSPSSYLCTSYWAEATEPPLLWQYFSKDLTK